MKVFRFMSKVEFEKYKNGSVLKNNKKHDGRTNSIGFCFFNVEDFTPEQAIQFLSGIVTFDVCAVFETDEKLKKTYGIYAKPIKSTENSIEDLINLFDGLNARFKATEYCITEYDKNKMKLIKYSEDIWKQWNPVKEQQKLKWYESGIQIQSLKSLLKEE